VPKIGPPYEFKLSLTDGFIFDKDEPFAWKGAFDGTYAVWAAPSTEIGFELFNFVRERIVKI
jgi:hypothetical protein